jgi:hypothetical protein
VVAVRVLDPSTFNHDVAWILYCAEQILDGARYPRDWLDPNPPGIFWLSVVPVALARALGIRPITAFDALVFLAEMGSVAACYWIFSRAYPRTSTGMRWAVCGLLAALLSLLPGYEFGQREHIVVIATLPLCFASACALAGRPLAPRAGLFVGAIAGLGLAIKPFFLLAWAAAELPVARARGFRAVVRAENLAIAAVHILYGLALLLFAREYAAVAALAWRVLDAYDLPWIAFVVNRATLVMAISLAVALLTRPTEGTRELRRVLACAAIGFWVVACLQRRGWSYHFLPAELACAALIAVCAVGATARRNALVLAGALLWGVLALGSELHAGRLTPRPSVVAGLAAIARDGAGDEPVLFLSTAVGPAFPVVNVAGVRWASRLSCLWPLPGLYSPAEWAAHPFRYRSREEMGADERAMIDAVIDDLARWSPALIFVDRGHFRQAIGRSDFEFVDYFSRDPRFTAIFAGYRDLGDALSFRVYQRGDLANGR